MSGALTSITLTWAHGGWVLLLGTQTDTAYIIKTDRNKPRIFKSVETALRFAKSFFAPSVTVILDSWEPSPEPEK